MKLLVPTQHKLQIARLVSLGLRAARRMLGRSERVETVRDGIRWSLDLTEGIDLAIYLGLYQKIGKYVAKSVLRRGTIALDIGANIGAFALPLAAHIGPTGRVIAIEPTVYAFEKLHTNLALNPALRDRVITIQALLGVDGEQQHTETVFSSWRLSGRADENQHPSHGGTPMSISGALRLPLDSLLANHLRLTGLAERITFVKLDVDGQEIDVIRSAKGFLRRNRPSLLVEIAPYVQNERQGGTQLLLREIAQEGYGFHDADTGVPFPDKLECLESLIPYGAGIDILCLPR
jgi:FkbM family methyltransferase